MSVTFVPIRHHGPGSARNAINELKVLKPDLILLEGAPEANEMIKYVGSAQLKPPVALLAYSENSPENASFFPLAEFSPEWQVMIFANKNNIKLSFFDLPYSNLMAFNPRELNVCQDGNPPLLHDPFDIFAKIDGLNDGEEWWNKKIEQRKNNIGISEAINLAVAELRKTLEHKTLKRDILREAAMRTNIRLAIKSGYKNIAVVCGAWHVPALKDFENINQKLDNQILKKLPKTKIICTWTPWTYNRMSIKSGYGAGIVSPGWYHHLWKHPNDDGTLWTIKIAKLLRTNGKDISSAHIIDTVRLANSLAALRNFTRPSLEEFNQAVTAVIGEGDKIVIKLIENQLIISDKIGFVSNNVPKVPLLYNIEQTAKKLRVPFSTETKEYNLDLRNPLHLNRSIFFRQLCLMEIFWAKEKDVSGNGTFKELWLLKHNPENIVKIIENAIWGNTLAEAAKNFAINKTNKASEISQLTKLLREILAANLSDVTPIITSKLDKISVSSSDIEQMMKAVPDLVWIVKYGDVRKLDFSNVKHILNLFIARILSNGISIFCNIKNEVAEKMLNLLKSTDYAVSTLNSIDIDNMWNYFITKIFNSNVAHQLLVGYAARILYNKNQISNAEVEKKVFYNSSSANNTLQKAYWFEGFLHSSAAVLLIDNNFWEIVNSWLESLDEKQFMELLPILRRTFSKYSAIEKRKLGEKAKNYNPENKEKNFKTNKKSEQAIKVIPLIESLLGI